MELFPAIDLRHGSAVRLAQGDFSRQQEYGDPLALAQRYAAAGATWVHVVDLEAARTGAASARGTVLAIAATGLLRVQTGGGVRTAHDAEELFAGGVDRVVLGTAAVADPPLLRTLAERYPGRVAVGLDHRGPHRRVAVSGWERESDVGLEDALDRLTGLPLAAVVVTSIDRDGVMGGPDLDGLQVALAASAHPVIASGGVRSVDDLRTLAALEADGRRLAGAVVGRALVDGSMTVEEAIAACEPCG